VLVFGYPIAGPVERVDAEEELNRVGLSYLAERWDLAPAACWGSRNTLRWRSSKPSRSEWWSRTGFGSEPALCLDRQIRGAAVLA
jgi:hypothetical protein